MANISNCNMRKQSKDAYESETYYDDSISYKDRIGIAVDRGMSKMFANTGDMKSSFAGLGPGHGLPAECHGEFHGTIKEFLAMCRKQEEA